MENQAYKTFRESSFEYKSNGWTVRCHSKSLILSNHGWKLCAKYDEILKQVIFDTDKKTITAKVDNPLLADNAPRTADLSSVPELFEDIRSNIEKILITGTYEKVVPNHERTIFEVF